jgi:ribosomal protein L24
MAQIRKGSKVIVVEGPQAGTEGIVTHLERRYDPDRGKMAWRVTIQPPGETAAEVQTRLSWCRPS